MPDSYDAQLLQVLRRQSDEDSFINGVLAECRGIFFQAELRSQGSSSMNRTHLQSCA